MLRRRVQVEHLTDAHIDTFLRHRWRERTRRWEDRPTLRRLFVHLVERGVLIAPAPDTTPPSPAQRAAEMYANYLRDLRNLAPATIHTRVMTVRSFLTSVFAEAAVNFEQLPREGIIKFVRDTARRCCHGTTCRVVADLRAFLRYAHHCGLIGVDLSGCIPAPANWSQSSIPKALDEEQVRRVLAHCDRSTPNGCRDRAIILLLARLGLRAGEVVAMSLDDIDWQAGELIVHNGQSHLDRMPLPHDVGTALAEYLRRGRPACSTRHVFVRAQAPLAAFSAGSAVASITRRAFNRANMNPPSKGAHVLRHWLATQMLRQGASLAEIGQVLRHRKQSTTTIYAKVDFTSLRAMALLGQEVPNELAARSHPRILGVAALSRVQAARRRRLLRDFVEFLEQRGIVRSQPAWRWIGP